MGRSKLPQELIEIGYRFGLAGRRVYFPKQKLHTLVARHTPEVLRNVEVKYEACGLTFYDESSARKLFSGMFGKSRIATRFNLKLRTAASVSSAAWKAWREWFGRKERPKLGKVREIASDSGCDYGSLFLSYLEIRKQLREEQKIDFSYYTGYHNVPEEVVQEVVALAKSSIESFPWKSS